jgi:hypothetical protein
MSPDEDEKGPTRRPPCAVKAARTVTTGGMGRHSTAVRPVPTHWDAELCRPLGNCGVVLMHFDELKVKDSRLLRFISESETDIREPMPDGLLAAAGAW